MSEPCGDASVTKKTPYSYIIVGYDGENYEPLIIGELGRRLYFDGQALMLLCGVERPSVGERKMSVPVKCVPADDIEKLRTLLSSIPAEVET